MGFTSLIDILGSMIIGAMLLLIMFRLNDSAIENNFTYGGELIAQQNLVAAVELLEYDFRRIGYCADPNKMSQPAITYADSTRITFLTDIAVSSSSPVGDGTVNTITYFLGPTSELSGTDNPRDRILYRQVDGETPKGSNLGITKLQLSYFSSLGAKIQSLPVSNPGQIRTIQIDLVVENSYPMVSYTDIDSTIYNTVFWRQIKIAAKNITEK